MRELFAEIGLLERLDAIALSAEVGKRKPHALIFESALAQAGVEPGEAVMVGDRLREDVAGAQALGMATVQARWFARTTIRRPSRARCDRRAARRRPSWLDENAAAVGTT